MKTWLLIVGMIKTIWNIAETIQKKMFELEQVHWPAALTIRRMKNLFYMRGLKELDLA